MRDLAVLLVLICFAVTPALADGPSYIDDRALKADLERKGNELKQAEKTTPNTKLQEQLAERKHYDGKPPAPAKLGKHGESLFDSIDDGVLVISRLYLCGRCDKLHANSASGFVISEDGLAVTNYHVMENTDEKTQTFVARTRDGRVVPIVEVLAGNKADDIALVRLGGDGFKPVPIARSAEIGERVHAVTHPAGRFYHYASGEIARFHMQRRAQRQPPVKRFTITAEYAKGSSGGPIFNDLGQVVAVVCSTNTVYYNVQNGDPRNPQMVFRDCVPYESILALFKPR